MSGMPGVPVMKKNYSDVFTADRITYIENIDGENFCTFPFSVNFYENELSLTEAAENNASYSDTERLLEYMANPENKVKIIKNFNKSRFTGTRKECI